MDLTEKKGYLTISLTVHKESSVLLRSTTGIQELFHVITVGDSNIIRLNKRAHIICRDAVRESLRKAEKTFCQ